MTEHQYTLHQTPSKAPLPANGVLQATAGQLSWNEGIGSETRNGMSAIVAWHRGGSESMLAAVKDTHDFVEGVSVEGTAGGGALHGMQEKEREKMKEGAHGWACTL